MKNKKYFLVSIIYVIFITFMCKCYAVDLSSNVMYEYTGKNAQAVLYTSCAASPHSIEVYNSQVKEDERGYEWIDLKKTWTSEDDSTPLDSTYYTIIGLSFHKKPMVKYNTSPTEFSISNNYNDIYYDKYVNSNNDPVDTTIRKSGVDRISINGQMARLELNTERNPIEKVYLNENSGNIKFDAKYLIYENKIICKYYVTGIENLINEGGRTYWSTIASIKAKDGKTTLESNEIMNSHDLIKAIYYNKGIGWLYGSKGINSDTGAFEAGKSAANDFDNILYRFPINTSRLQVRFFVKENGTYKMIPMNDLDSIIGKQEDNNEKSPYVIETNATDGNENKFIPTLANYFWTLYGEITGSSGTRINEGCDYNTIWTIYNNKQKLSYKGVDYSYKFARFGYDTDAGAAALNLSEKKNATKDSPLEFSGGAENLVVNFYYDPEEAQPKYKVKYVDESGKEISDSSAETPIPKKGCTVNYKSITGYKYEGLLTSEVDSGSLGKASVNVKNVTNKSSSKYIPYGKKDVLVVFVYSKITYYLRVQHAIYNDTGGNYENLLSLIDINEDFKQEKVTNFSSKSLINNAYYQYILKSNETDVELSEKEYKTTNALYKFNSMYFLRKMYNFPIPSSTYESGDGKNENGEVNVTLSKNNGTKIGAILTYFYDQFPKRTVNVYRKYIDDKNNEIALISPTGKYTVNNFKTYKENQNLLMGIFYYGEKSIMPSVSNNLKYITANEKDIYEYNGEIKITYYNDSNDKNPISNKFTKKGLGTSISISSKNSKNKKQIDIVFYYTKKPDPNWITVCPTLNFKTVADYLKNAEGKENVVANSCTGKDRTYECTDDDTTTQELVVPIGEAIKPVVNVPKVILIDSLSYSYDNTRGGIWQEVSEKNGKYNLRVVGYKALVLTEVKIKQNNESNFVSLLSEDKVVYSRSNMANNSILSTELVNSNLGEDIGKALSKKFEYSGSKKAEYEKHIYKYATSLTDINNYISNEIAGSNITIDANAYNGVKSAYATVKYKAVNIGITDFSYYSNISPYLKEGSSSSILSGDNSNNESGEYERTIKNSVKKKEYSTNSSYVNVYAPLSLSIDVKGINTVDHTTGEESSTLIQNNAKLRVTSKLEFLTSYTEMLSIQHIKEKYLGAYYYKFGFKVDYGGKTYEAGSWIKGGESIEVLVNDSRLDNNNKSTTSVVSDYMNEIVCMAVTKNIPSYSEDNLTTIYNKYSSSSNITIPDNCKDSNGTTNNEWSETLKSNNKVKQDAFYAVKATKKIASIGRIYDFRITDCTDVDFKSVFRESNSGVNSLTGTVYFSGIKELDIFNSASSNELKNRKDSYTIPLGPYKHTNSNYVDAPKMGYRISFDVKTTGKYVTSEDDANKLSNNYRKYVKITPSYYYIKKDGSDYKDNITLYYKNSSNKYVKFINSGFKISYKPNDGYRNVTNLGITNITDMFTDKYVTLDVSNEKGFVLDINSMCTNYSGYVQSWYGEFKLPNTTIAVTKEGDINNPLSDGYIGVKFNIECIYKYDNQEVVVSYNTNDKNASKKNTTQWDYEGYLGFKNAGKEVTANDGLYLQFPKGKLMISLQKDYEKIRGTVVFFDLDNRASNDFE